jgi:hypothetical protein
LIQATTTPIEGPKLMPALIPNGFFAQVIAPLAKSPPKPPLHPFAPKAMVFKTKKEPAINMSFNINFSS